MQRSISTAWNNAYGGVLDYNHDFQIFVIATLVENYAKKSRNQNQLLLFWLAWYAIAKRLLICSFDLVIKLF
jgi:hypothetical protein